MTLSRRDMIATTALGAAVLTTTPAGAATFGNPDAPPQGAVNARNPASVTDPGPQTKALANQFPVLGSPPATDVGKIPMSWASFNTAHRRIQNGGWAREVTQADFAISETFAGVNMRLAAGGIREMHWHQAAEWAYVTYGNCRITVLDPQGRPYVADVKAGDIWYFPPGYPHSLQGTGEDGSEFVLCFDDGMASEFNTLLLTDWFAHTPPDILAENFGVPADIFAKVPLNNLWIFQGQLPGSLTSDQAAVTKNVSASPYPFTFSLGTLAPFRQNRRGSVRIADSENFKVSTTVAAALITVPPGELRELHWHPNADEWQYYIKGRARMTIFNTGPNASTFEFGAGDIGYVKRNYGHYIKNIGDTDLQFFAVFRAPRYEEISLSDWLTHTPPALVAQHLNVAEATIAKWPEDRPAILPR